jgi:hypothetical protein
VGRIADHRMIQIPDLHIDDRINAGERAEIAEVAVTTDPYRRAEGKVPGRGNRREPVVKVRDVTSGVGVDRFRDLELSSALQQGRPLRRDWTPSSLQ